MNKKKIKENFSKAAAEYNKFAKVQKSVVKKLIGLASFYLKDKTNILDLGSGTSFIAKEISKKNKKLNIFESDLSLEMLKQWKNRPQKTFAINCDIEKLPFKPNSFDLIISSFSLQWIDLKKTFLQINQMLKKNGIILICLPVEESLEEIKIASQKSGCNFNMLDFPNVLELKKTIEQANFQIKDFILEKKQQNFIDPIFCLQSIKKIGGSYQKKQNLINKKKILEFKKFCLENFNNKNKKLTNSFNISWLICYFVLSKKSND
jgi:malonyl-CoA O-methyltransferase